MKNVFLSLLLTLCVLISLSAAPILAAPDSESTGQTEVTEAPTVSTAATSSGAVSNAGLDATGALVTPADSDFDAAAILLYEMNSGTMVYAKNIDEQRYPASLTKVMTCLLALEHCDLSQSVTVSETALADIDPDGSSSGLLVGETLTMEQLLYCLMIESGNDAAKVVAECVSGSEIDFVALMNEKAAELGCESTHFANPHGLHSDYHYTTARDMARIMMAALEHEAFRNIYSTSRYEMPATNLSPERILVTTNFLIGTTLTSAYYDSRVVGGKTGFTTPAGRCVMCTAVEDDLNYLCVVMGASNVVTEEGTTYGSFIVASEVLDLGFDNFTFAEVLSPLAPVAQVPVQNAVESVVLSPAQPVTTMLPKGYDPALLQTVYTFNDPEGLSAPLAAGQVVGTVREYYEDLCVGETDLVTVTAVQKQTLTAATIQTVEEIQESPWRLISIVLAAVLILLLALYFWSAWVRYQNRKRRRRRKRGS